MNQTHKFTKYWRKMPADHVLNNVKYLQQNYKKYPMVISSENQINLGDDIIITKNTYDNKTLYTINGFYSPVTNKELKYLWALCKNTATSADKTLHWCEHHIPNFVQVIGYTAAATILVGLGFGINGGIKKAKQSKEQYVQQRINDAIKEYEASKTINYTDVKNQKTR